MSGGGRAALVEAVLARGMDAGALPAAAALIVALDESTDRAATPRGGASDGDGVREGWAGAKAPRGVQRDETG